MKTVLIILKKRLPRLLVPYYIFLVIASITIYFFDRHNFTYDYFKSSILLFGGVDTNWIILLFVIFTVLQPLLLHLKGRSIILWNISMALSFITAVILLFYRPSSINYKLYYWIPWSIFIFYSYYQVRAKDKRRFYIFNIIFWSILFFISRFILSGQGKSLGLFNNEYPPNLYHLAYGLFILNFIFLVFPKKDVYPQFVKNIVRFISVNSYTLFFIHWLLIRIFAYYLFPWRNPWYLFFITILFSSFAVQYLLNLGIRTIRKQYNT